MSRPPGKGLGRIWMPDPRDSNYPMRKVVRRVPERTIYRRPGAVLDQANTSSCVGHAWRAWMDAGPIAAKPGQGVDPFFIYARAQELDEYPGIEPEVEGTSVRAGAMVMQEHARVANYAWGFSTVDVVGFLIERGPVVLGTNWYETMGSPDSRGIISVDGEIEGGHAFLCYGYNATEKLFRCQNSWGRQWSVGGRFWIRRADLDRLINEEGEACGGLELPWPAK